MDILHLLQERYTTKAYDARVDLTDEELAQVRQILRLSPSSINSQPWAFQFIARGALKDQLAAHSLMNQERVQQASHLLILSTYREVATFERERLPHLSASAQAYYRRAVAAGGEEAVRSWMRAQVYLALGVLLTGVASLGIDSTPMEGFDAEAYDKILGHASYCPVLAVALGRRASDDQNQPALTPKVRRQDVFL